MMAAAKPRMTPYTTSKAGIIGLTFSMTGPDMDIPDVGVPTWTQNDVQLNYFTPWDGRITVGAQNVTNKEPPVGVGDVGSRDYDFELYPGYGRVVYFRYRQAF